VDHQSVAIRRDDNPSFIHQTFAIHSRRIAKYSVGHHSLLFGLREMRGVAAGIGRAL
jgi:hypothetical protein